MALTYNWKLTGLKKKNTADITNLVVGTQWKVTGTDEDGNEGTFNGGTPFDAPDEGEVGFVPYEELTEELVLGWIKTYVENQPTYWDHINERILKEIEENKFKTEDVTTENLPWSETSGSVDTPTA